MQIITNPLTTNYLQDAQSKDSITITVTIAITTRKCGSANALQVEAAQCRVSCSSL